MRLADQVAVITGAGRGLGEQVARAFCREGAKVVLASEAASEVEAVAEDLRALGASALAVFADVREEESVRSLFERTREHFGEVDVLLNCAGVLFVKAVVETEAEEWDNLIRINLRGTFLCSREVLKGMVPRKRGLILNVTSGFGYKGGALVSAYSASKFAVEGFSQSLAAEVKEHGIRVNTLHPGGVARTAMGRASTARLSAHQADPPEDQWQPVDALVEPAVFLASAEGEGADVTGRSVNAREWNAERRGRSG